MKIKGKYNPLIKTKDSANFLSRELLRWYDQHRRDLPWRVPLGTSPDSIPDAYHVFLSEAMLQQTQVATVIPYFHRFLAAFPTIQSLAQSTEQEVLKLWQGLGYYSRARNLRLAAIVIVNEYDGVVPSDLVSLQKLPGIGRYTSGAISSLAYNQRSPILDGNVIRVLCRFDAIRGDPRDKLVLNQLWQRAEQIIPNKRSGDFNSALMELGATVCTPKSPKCETCPLKKGCQAFKENIQDQIPPSKKSNILKIEKRWVICIKDKQGRYLMQQRPPTGRWAGMWQFFTLPNITPSPGTPGEGWGEGKEVRDQIPFKVTALKPLTQLKHTLTHRKYQFDVFTANLPGKPKPIPDTKWLSLEDCHKLPMSKVQGMVLELIEK